MAPHPRLWVLLAGAAAAVAGLALGAASQMESFLQSPGTPLPPVPSAASGNLVILTGLLVAAGAATAAAALSRRNARETLPLAAGVALSAYILTWVVQSAWPNYVVLQELRSARLSINPLSHNQPASPSLLLPVHILALAALVACGACTVRLLAKTPSPPHPRLEDAQRRLVSTIAAVAPFLCVAAAGAILLLATGFTPPESAAAGPDTGPYLGPYLAVLPVLALCSVGFLVTLAVRMWHLRAAARNARLAPMAQEAWQGLGRAEAILAGVLAATALVGVFLAPLQSELLLLGRTFGFSARAHVVSHLALLLPLAVLVGVHRTGAQALGRAHTGRRTLEHLGLDPVFLTVCTAMAASLVGAVAAALLSPGALWAWLFALTPMGLLALRHGGRVDGAPALLLLAYTLWGLGNTVAATFDGFADVTLRYVTGPGLLGLWRLLAATVLGIAVVRLLLAAAGPVRPSLKWPLSVGAAFCTGAVVLLLLPLSAWLLPRQAGGAEIGVGSVLASQDPSVQWVMLSLAAAAGVAAAWLTARLHRPDWFRGPSLPVQQHAPVPA